RGRYGDRGVAGGGEVGISARRPRASALLILQLSLAIQLGGGPYSASAAPRLDGDAATGTSPELPLLEGRVPTPTTTPDAAPRARSAAGGVGRSFVCRRSSFLGGGAARDCARATGGQAGA